MEQGQLFEVVPPNNAVPGLTLKLNYITPEEERDLLLALENGPWENDWRRRIQQYGAGYSDSGGKPGWIRDFPGWLEKLAERVGKDSGLERFPDNCVINEYIPPLGIAPHRDYPAFGGTIACVSLGSDIILDFVMADRSQRVPVHMPGRSLWVTNGCTELRRA